MVNTRCQLDWVWNHLGDTLLSISLMVFPTFDLGMLSLNGTSILVLSQHKDSESIPRKGQKEYKDWRIGGSAMENNILVMAWLLAT